MLSELLTSIHDPLALSFDIPIDHYLNDRCIDSFACPASKARVLRSVLHIHDAQSINSTSNSSQGCQGIVDM